MTDDGGFSSHHVGEFMKVVTTAQTRGQYEQALAKAVKDCREHAAVWKPGGKTPEQLLASVAGQLRMQAHVVEMKEPALPDKPTPDMLVRARVLREAAEMLSPKGAAN